MLSQNFIKNSFFQIKKYFGYFTEKNQTVLFYGSFFTA